MIGLDPREGFVNPDGRALEPGVAVRRAVYLHAFGPPSEKP